MNELEATRAKLKCLEMVEGTKLHWREMFRLKGCCMPAMAQDMKYPFDMYEFALGVVEGKPVWEGDGLWRTDLVNKKTTITKENFISLQSYLSWSPPTHKTVMVELPIEDVRYFSSLRGEFIIHTPSYRFADLCRKALEQLK